MAWLIQKLCEVVRDGMMKLVMMVLEWWESFATVNNAKFNSIFDGAVTSASGAESANLIDALTKNVLQPVAVGIILAILIFYLYRAMFSRHDSDVEDPIHLVVWSGFSLLMVFSASSLLSYVTVAVTKIEGWISEVFTGMQITNNMDTYEETLGAIWDTGENSGLFGAIFSGTATFLFNTEETIGTIVSLIITIILFFMLGKRLLNLLFLYVERYTVYWALSTLAPLGFCAFGARRTQDISWRYFRMILSSLINLLLTKVLVYIYVYLMFYCLFWDAATNFDGSFGDGIAWRIFIACVACAFYGFIGRIDEYMSMLGLTTATTPTGGSLFSTGGGAMMNTAGSVSRGMAGGMMRGVASGMGNTPMASALNAMAGGPKEAGKKAGEAMGRGAMNVRNANAAKQPGAKDASMKPQDQKNVAAALQNGGSMNSSRAVRNAIGSSYANNMGGKPHEGVVLDPNGNKASMSQAATALGDPQNSAVAGRMMQNGGMKAASIAEGGVDPKSADFSSYLDQNATAGADGVRHAYGSMTGSDGASHQVEFTDSGYGWTAASDNGVHGSAGYVASSMGASSADVYAGKPVTLTSSSISSSPNGTAQSAMEQMNATANSAFGESYMGVGNETVQDGTITGTYCAADGETFKNFTCETVSESAAEGDPHCMYFEDLGVYGRITNISKAEGSFTCKNGEVFSAFQSNAGLNSDGSPM